MLTIIEIEYCFYECLQRVRLQRHTNAKDAKREIMITTEI